MKYPQGCILQFAKTPELGKVKTRMIPVIGGAGALALHRQLVTHTFSQMIGAAISPFQLWVSGAKVDPFFHQLAHGFQCTLKLQQGADLGQRMAQAMSQVLQRYRYALIIGSDCPMMESAYVTSAMQRLDQGDEVVIGPATDGGYVLIGMRQSLPALFQGIEWGSAKVFSQTEQRLRELQCRWSQLETLSDVDRPEDLGTLETCGINYAVTI